MILSKVIYQSHSCVVVGINSTPDTRLHNLFSRNLLPYCRKEIRFTEWTIILYLIKEYILVCSHFLNYNISMVFIKHPTKVFVINKHYYIVWHANVSIMDCLSPSLFMHDFAPVFCLKCTSWANTDTRRKRVFSSLLF